MPTQCKPLSFAFQGCQGRRVAAAFDGGAITSNAGVLLLREIDRSAGLLDQVAGCFTDYRDPRLTEHSVGTLVRQRVMGITLGYEDLNDHDQLRHDPVLALLSGKLEGHRKDCAPLAGKSTLNRLEHAPPRGEPGRYHRIGHDADALQGVLLESFIDSWKGGRPSRLVLDIDATDDEVHGRQEGRFFHGYYGHYCFLPLYITCGGRPLFAQLRPGNADPAGGVTGPLGRIVERLRERWPGLEILLRADASYAREEILAWCEGNGVDYVIGLARNSRLVEKIGWELADAQAEAKRRGRPARRFKEFLYATLTSWSRKRRVVAKAEHLPLPRRELLRRADGTIAGDYSPLKALQPLQPESPSDLFQQFVPASAEAEHVAFVQQRHPRLARVGLPQDPAHKLGDPRLRHRVGEDREDVGERAVPALLKRLFGDDEADVAVAGQQAANVVHLLQFVLRAGLDCDVLRRDSRVLEQVFPHVVSVNVSRLSLLSAGAFHLDDADGPDVGAGLSFVKPCLGLQGFAVFDRLQQGAAPVAARLVAYVQVELDHLLGVEFPAQNLDEHVRALGRSGRKLDDHAGVESFESSLRVGAVRLVSLVESTRTKLDALSCSPRTT